MRWPKLGVVLDTGFLYGLKDKDDPRNAASKTLLRSFDWQANAPALTTNVIVSEVYTLLSARSKGNKTLLASLDVLFWGDEKFFSIVYMDEADSRKTVEIMRKYSSAKKVLSFPDASLIQLAQARGINVIISFDEHFDGILTRTPSP